MKNIIITIKNKTYLLTLILFLITGAITLTSFVIDENQEIIGTWISETDPRVKWVFLDNGKCIWYYDNQQRKYFDFMISNTSPQCGKPVDIKSYTSYLNLSNIDEHCYLVNGINIDGNGILSLTYMVNNKIMLFNKQ